MIRWARLGAVPVSVAVLRALSASAEQAIDALGNPHTFFFWPSEVADRTTAALTRLPAGRAIDSTLGYLNVPGVHGSKETFVCWRCWILASGCGRSTRKRPAADAFSDRRWPLLSHRRPETRV